MSNLYDIVIAPDPVLKEQAHVIENIDDSVKAQIERMIATMYDAPGIGLAANQVGMLNRVFVLDVPEGSWEYGDEDKDGVLQVQSAYRSGEDEEEECDPPPRNPIAMINPEIFWSSEQRSVFEEGCLSLPAQYGIVERPAKVRVKYLDVAGGAQTLEVEGLFSHAVQHELDHLNGVLFVDYLSSLKRKMIIRKMEKLKKQQVL